MSSTTAISCLLALLLAALACNPARAVPPDHGVQASVLARGNGVSAAADTGMQAGPAVTAGPVGFDAFTATSHYTSGIVASADYAHLWGQGFATEVHDPSAFPVQSDVSTIDAVQFFDTLTLNSASLPLGSPVPLTVVMVLADDLSSGPTTCCSNVQAHGTYAFSPLSASDQAGPGMAISQVRTFTADLIWFTGQANTVGAFLAFDAVSSPGCCTASSGHSEVNNADVSFSLLLPVGVGVSSASGHAYAPPVPEPASGALWLLGLLALAAWRQRPSASGGL